MNQGEQLPLLFNVERQLQKREAGSVVAGLLFGIAGVVTGVLGSIVR